ncbi:MAG: 50S ribosomal protein L21 [Thermoleophilaceae bacterium]
MKCGGKQYRVETGDSLVVDRMGEDEGAKVTLTPLMLADGEDSVLGGDELEQVNVEATVTRHERGKKIHGLKFKPKRGYKRRYGHRSDLTRLQIGEIKLLDRQPAGKTDSGSDSKDSKDSASVANPSRKEESDGS